MQPRQQSGALGVVMIIATGLVLSGWSMRSAMNSPSVVAAPPAAPLISQLERISDEGAISREDYFSPETGWDLEGLRSDIQIHMGDIEM